MSETPDPRLTVVVGGVEREIFMSYGLQNLVARILGPAEGLAQTLFDPMKRDLVVHACLAGRDADGRVKDEPIEVDAEVGHQILEWVMEHTLAFLFRTAQLAERLGAKYGDQVKAMVSSMSSQAGSPA